MWSCDGELGAFFVPQDCDTRFCVPHANNDYWRISQLQFGVAAERHDKGMIVWISVHSSQLIRVMAILRSRLRKTSSYICDLSEKHSPDRACGA